MPTVPPWWYCPPKEVEPCPVRLTGFVPLSQYDENFKFPTQSSRVPSQVTKDGSCTPCSPTLITPDEEPTPECMELTVTPYAYANVVSSANAPSWYQDDSGPSFILRLDYDPGLYYMFYNDGQSYSVDSDEPFPFNGNYDAILPGQIALSIDAAYEDHDWTCVNVSTYTPA